MRSVLPRRGATLVVASALTISTLGAVSAPAQAHPAGDRAVTPGAGWLTSQLTDGLVHNDEFDFDDLGLSADVAFALDSVGGHDETVTRIADAVSPHVATWYDSYGTTYTGSAAKAMVLAQTAGRDATNFGGQNLQAVVEDRVATSEPIIGRVQNEGETDWQTGLPADSLNVISQGWAARALGAAGSSKASDVSAFLLEQQCAEGFFRAKLTADKTSPEQGCTSADTPSVDTTALTAVNLLATPGASATVQDAAMRAIAWLKTQQAADGSFSAGGPEGHNANSTGLAGWALGAAGETGAATKAAGWLRGVQIADLTPCVATLAAENGAVAFKPDTLTATRSSGRISVGQRDQYLRATAQALPALAHVPAASAPLAISAPGTAVENSTVTVSVAGLGAGEAGCVSFGSVAKPVTGTGGVVTVAFQLPAGVATHTFTLTTLAGSTAARTSSTATPVPATAVPATPEVGELVAKRVVTAKNNWFKLVVNCDDTEWCDGKIVVRTLRRVRTGPNGSASKVLIARGSYSVAPNSDEVLRLKVRRPARRMLEQGRTRVKVVQSAPGADRATMKFWLRAK